MDIYLEKFDTLEEETGAHALDAHLSAIATGLQVSDLIARRQEMFEFGDELRAVQKLLARYGHRTFNRVITERFGKKKRRWLYYCLRIAVAVRGADRMTVARSFDIRALYALTASS